MESDQEAVLPPSYPLSEVRSRFERAAKRARANEVAAYKAAEDDLFGVTKEEAVRHYQFHKRNEVYLRRRDEIYAISALMREREYARFQTFVKQQFWRLSVEFGVCTMLSCLKDMTSTVEDVVLRQAPEAPFTMYERAMERAALAYRMEGGSSLHWMETTVGLERARELAREMERVRTDSLKLTLRPGATLPKAAPRSCEAGVAARQPPAPSPSLQDMPPPEFKVQPFHQVVASVIDHGAKVGGANSQPVRPLALPRPTTQPPQPPSSSASQRWVQSSVGRGWTLVQAWSVLGSVWRIIEGEGGHEPTKSKSEPPIFPAEMIAEARRLAAMRRRSAEPDSPLRATPASV